MFLTAAHCDEGVSRIAVTFETSYVFPTGATYWGTWHADPKLLTEAQGDPHDVAVVVLDNAGRDNAGALPRGPALSADCPATSGSRRWATEPSR